MNSDLNSLLHLLDGVADNSYNTGKIIAIARRHKDNLNASKKIFDMIIDNIYKRRPEHLLSAFSVIDSVIKKIGNPYVLYLSKQLVAVFVDSFKELRDFKVRNSFFMLRDSWTDIFPTCLLAKLDAEMSRYDKNWPVSSSRNLPPRTSSAQKHKLPLINTQPAKVSKPSNHSLRKDTAHPTTANLSHTNMRQSHPNMDMLSPKMQLIPPNTQTIHPSMGQSHPKMQMIPPNMRQSHPNMQMLPPNAQPFQPNIQMMPPNMKMAPPSMRPSQLNLHKPPPFMQGSFLENQKPNAQMPFFNIHMPPPNMDMRLSQESVSPPNVYPTTPVPSNIRYSSRKSYSPRSATIFSETMMKTDFPVPDEISDYVFESAQYSLDDEPTSSPSITSNRASRNSSKLQFLPDLSTLFASVNAEVALTLRDYSYSLFALFNETEEKKLHEGQPCGICFMRFKFNDNEKYKEHLDFHIIKPEPSGTTRKYNKHFLKWVKTEKITEKVCAVSKKRGWNDRDEVKPKGPPIEFELGKERCSVCNDKFTIVFNDEVEAFVLGDAVLYKGKPYHPICVEDSEFYDGPE